MDEVTVTARVRAVAEHVYDFLLDSRHDPLWCPLVDDVALVEGTPGVGARYRYRQGRGPGLEPVWTTLRTTAARRPHHLAWEGRGRGMTYEASILLARDDEHTAIRHTNRVTHVRRVRQVAWFGLAHAVLRLQLRNLRRELER